MASVIRWNIYSTSKTNHYVPFGYGRVIPSEKRKPLLATALTIFLLTDYSSAA